MGYCEMRIEQASVIENRRNRNCLITPGQWFMTCKPVIQWKKYWTALSESKEPSIQNRMNVFEPPVTYAKMPPSATRLATGRKNVLNNIPASRKSGWRYAVSAHVVMMWKAVVNPRTIPSHEDRVRKNIRSSAISKY